MGTSKRDRQRANRQARLEELARQARRTKSKRRGLRIAIVVIGALVLLFGLSRLIGGDDDDPTSTPPVTTVDPALTTLDPTATTVDPTATTLDPTATTVDPAATTTEGPTTTAGPTTTVAEAFAYGEGSCPEPDGPSEPQREFDAAPQRCIEDGVVYTAEVTTNRGSLTITLDAERSPGNVNNFVVLSRYRYYDGTGCHRVIKEFVVQCGRPGEDEAAPGYTVPDELPSEGEYEEGMVVMANTGSPDSGGGQWFIITGPQGVALPPSYSIIGRVTEGYGSTVRALENLADPLARNGVPPLLPITIESIEITESDAPAADTETTDATDATDATDTTDAPDATGATGATDAPSTTG